MTYLNNFSNLELILISIYTFVDDFIKGMVKNIKYALQKPTQNIPPVKKHNLSLAELVSLAIFRFFSGQTNWKKFYHFVKTYHAKDFPNLPSYQNFLDAVNKLSFFAIVLLQALMQFFRKITGLKNIKFADSMKLEIFFSSRRRHTRFKCDWSSDVCSSDLRPRRATSYDGRPVISSPRKMTRPRSGA